MLNIDSFLLQSKTEIGLFTRAKIYRGDVIWRYNSSTSQKFWKNEYMDFIEKLSIDALKEFINFSYIKSGSIYYIRDNSRYINHSEYPNAAFKDDNTIIAIRDIEKGEEILTNYLLSFDRNDFFYIKVSEQQSKHTILKEIRKSIYKAGRPEKSFQF